VEEVLKFSATAARTHHHGPAHLRLATEAIGGQYQINKCSLWTGSYSLWRANLA
jgi:hypothetical protein